MTNVIDNRSSRAALPLLRVNAPTMVVGMGTARNESGGRGPGLRRVRRCLTMAPVVLALTFIGTVPRPAAAAQSDVGPMVVVLDASGSMLDRDQHGVRKIDGAKKALTALINHVPDGSMVGLRVFGRHGAVVAGRAACHDSDLLVPVRPLRRASMRSALNSLEARGWTPLGFALSKGAADLPRRSRGSVILISDGVDECFPRFGVSPCSVARNLARSSIDLKVQTIGITADARARRQLKCIARVTGGRYWDVDDTASLAAALSRSVPRLPAKAAPPVPPPPQPAAPLGASLLVVLLAAGAAGMVATTRGLLRKRKRAYW